MIGDDHDRVNAAADHALLIAREVRLTPFDSGFTVRRVWFCDSIDKSAKVFAPA
jgi:hypothetical protein